MNKRQKKKFKKKNNHKTYEGAMRQKILEVVEDHCSGTNNIILITTGKRNRKLKNIKSVRVLKHVSLCPDSIAKDSCDKEVEIEFKATKFPLPKELEYHAAMLVKKMQKRKELEKEESDKINAAFDHESITVQDYLKIWKEGIKDE